ncbi:MAG TPA: hypothetical protein VJ521_01625, partial [Acidobacteriota bacterium]|nr:hypothetical protein [Acidobacteriota bacterium]
AAPKPLASLNNLERQLFFSQWIYNDSNGSLKPLALLDFAPGENKLIQTHLSLQMNGKDVLGTKRKQRSVHVAGYLLDSENKLVDYSFIPVRLNTDQTREQLLSGGLNFSDVFLSRPGQYSLRGIIVDVDRPEVTTFLLPVKVPEFSTLTMTVPVIPGQVNQGIMVRKEYSSQTKRGLPVSYPYETQLGVFYPDFAPKIVKDKTYFVYFRIYNLALGPAQKPLPQLGMILKSPTGEETPIGDVVISERREINKTDYALLLQFQLRDVNAGAYNLVPYVRDSIANKTIWQQTNIEVIDK